MTPSWFPDRMLSRLLQFGLLLCLLVRAGWAQEGSPLQGQEESPLQGREETPLQRREPVPFQEIQAVVPALVLGEWEYHVPSFQCTDNLRFVEGSGNLHRVEDKDNLLSIGACVNVLFDDNMLGSSSNPQSDTALRLSPHLAMQQTRDYTKWSLSYLPSVDVYQNLSAWDRVNQYVGGRFEQRLSPYLTLRVREEFSVLNDPFESISGNELMAEGGGLSAPEANVILPNYRRTNNVATTAVSYSLSEYDTLGLSGSFDNINYANSTQAPVSQQEDSRSSEAGAFYCRQLSPRQIAGAQYEFVDASQDVLSTRIRINRILYLHRLDLAGNGVVSVFVGPEYTQASQLASPLSTRIRGSSLTPAVFATYWWLKDRNQLRVSYMHRIDFAFNFSSVHQANSGSLQLQRALGATWSGALSFQAGDYEPAVLNTFASSGRVLDMGISVGKKLTGNIVARVSYRRVWQDGLWNNTPLVNHDRRDASVDYQFSRPLGR